uniref:Galectin n=1 Tax=Dracunculus medinensis TaxID=318479 RepID=A0A0N4UPB5_DRAME
LVLSSVLSNDSEEIAREEDKKQSKEENYRKFIGERDYRLPFKTKLAVPLDEGMTIHALGTVNSEPKRIDFNFHKGPDETANLPLHFSIRFDEGIFSGKLVYNTFIDGNWSDNEQRISNPFRANEKFDLRVRILNGKYEAFANRKKIGEFGQRMTLDGVDHVSVSGDLSNLRLFHYGGRLFPIPYTAVANLTPGKRLDISALPTGKRINIDLYHSDRQQALELSIRFNEGAVVRNAMENHNWGKEERDGVISKISYVPIKKKNFHFFSFDLTIINEKFSYQIFFNQKRFATFAHRGSPDDIEILEISGDLELYTVTINDALGV